MSVASEITRINGNIAAAYSACADKGATLPQAQNSANLAGAVAGLITPNAAVTYDQRNISAKGYTENVEYDPTDYSSSALSSYVVSTAYNKSKPAGATVTLPSAGTLVIQDGEKSIFCNVSAGQYTIYNITPGHTGAYYLKNSSDNILAAGLLKPTGALRMIYGQSTENIRDLGGWACDGGTVKYGKLFRGGEINASDAALLHDLLGIRAELNLRWDSEISRNYSLIGSDVDFKHISGPWYTLGNSASWLPDAHKQILEYVMEKAIAGIPLYFHCSAGADRTGTAAFLIESLLGMSQCDTDKDYELTSFYTGIGSDTQARRRDENEWKNYMAEFSSYQGSTMRDKVVNWALTVGISIDKINAFRSATIDGTPSTLSGDAGTVSVTRALTGVSSDNTSNTNAKYQPYTAQLTPDSGKVITSVQVTMGGTDITEEVFSGRETTFRYPVSYSLTDCTLSVKPKRVSVVSGECFCCTLQADSGYSLNDEDNPTISITMGGSNMSSCYKDGVINIPRVTGNLVITVAAAASAPAYTNVITESVDSINGSSLYNTTGYKGNYRYNSSMAEASESGTFTTGYIRLSYGDTIRFYGNVFSGVSGGYNSAVYKADGTLVCQFTPRDFYNNTYGHVSAHASNIDYDSSTHVLHSFVWNESYDVWVRFTLIGTFTEGVTVVTVNEEM